MNVHQATQNFIPSHPLAHFEGEEHIAVILGRAETVDRGDTGHDHDVRPREQSAGGGKAHPVDVLVDRAVLLDVGVGARDVGLGLIVVVIADEIFHGVLREKAFQLAVELCGQSFVVD